MVTVSMAKVQHCAATMPIYREQALLDALEKTKEILFLMDKELHQMERLKAIINIIQTASLKPMAEGNIGMCQQRLWNCLACRTIGFGKQCLPYPQGPIVGKCLSP